MRKNEALVYIVLNKKRYIAKIIFFKCRKQQSTGDTGCVYNICTLKHTGEVSAILTIGVHINSVFHFSLNASSSFLYSLAAASNCHGYHLVPYQTQFS